MFTKIRIPTARDHRISESSVLKAYIPACYDSHLCSDESKLGTSRPSSSKPPSKFRWKNCDRVASLYRESDQSARGAPSIAVERVEQSTRSEAIISQVARDAGGALVNPLPCNLRVMIGLHGDWTSGAASPFFLRERLAQERRWFATTPTPAGWNIKVAFAPMRPALNYLKEGYAMSRRNTAWPFALLDGLLASFLFLFSLPVMDDICGLYGRGYLPGNMH